MHTRLELPVPSAEAIAHCELVSELIRTRIAAAGGWIDFSEYMRLCLYEPGLGYYSAGAAKFGAAGDFVTAPEISPLFGSCLARALAPALADLCGPAILEIGGGRGTLAADLMLGLEALGVLPERYLMLEVSADLRERQREELRARIPRLADRVVWLDRLPAEPLQVVVIANEVVDALPASRFRNDPRGILAIGVDAAAATFRDAARPAQGQLLAAVTEIPVALRGNWPSAYTSEVRPELPGWIAGLAGIVERGWFLLFDYGWPRRDYYHVERATGTLACHYRHRAHYDPYFMPGLQDITAWVDFTSIAEAGSAAGLAVGGFTTQGNFLLGAGFESVMAELSERGEGARLAAARQARTLLLPGEMGEAIKVIGLQRGDCVAPKGFDLRDLRDRL